MLLSKPSYSIALNIGSNTSNTIRIRSDRHKNEVFHPFCGPCAPRTQQDRVVFADRGYSTALGARSLSMVRRTARISFIDSSVEQDASIALTAAMAVWVSMSKP